MKKILKFILSFIWLLAVRVYAYNVNYSDWSEEYPYLYDEFFIESEDRYLWYKEERINEEYLSKENIKEKKVDYEDYIYSDETYKSIIKPDTNENKIINEEKVTYDENKIIGFRISGNLELSELEILESDSLKTINLSNKNDYKYLFDGRYSIYNKIDKVNIYFEEPRSIDNILFIIYHKNNSEKIKFEYLVSDDYALYEKEYNTFTKNTEIKKEELNKKSNEVTFYTYSKKLYKTYDVNIIKNDEYLKELDGYIKDESTKKTFYRYVTDEYVYVNIFSNTIVDEKYCYKRFCTKIKVTKKDIPKEEPKEEKVIYNPKTIDTIYEDLIILIISVICTIIIFRQKIFLVLSNRFKRLKKYSNIFL